MQFISLIAQSQVSLFWKGTDWNSCYGACLAYFAIIKRVERILIVELADGPLALDTLSLKSARFAELSWGTDAKAWKQPRQGVTFWHAPWGADILHLEEKLLHFFCGAAQCGPTVPVSVSGLVKAALLLYCKLQRGKKHWSCSYFTSSWLSQC